MKTHTATHTDNEIYSEKKSVADFSSVSFSYLSLFSSRSFPSLSLCVFNVREMAQVGLRVSVEGSSHLRSGLKSVINADVDGLRDLYALPKIKDGDKLQVHTHTHTIGSLHYLPITELYTLTTHLRFFADSYLYSHTHMRRFLSIATNFGYLTLCTHRYHFFRGLLLPFIPTSSLSHTLSVTELYRTYSSSLAGLPLPFKLTHAVSHLRTSPSHSYIRPSIASSTSLTPTLTRSHIRPHPSLILTIPACR